MSLLFAPEAAPFLIAAGMVLAIGIVEGLAVLVGLSISHWLENAVPDFDFDAPHSVAEKLLGWLYIGKAPTLALLVAFLTIFAAAGLTFQVITGALIGIYAPAWIAAIVAFIPALPGMRAAGGLLEKLVPSDETRAVSDDTLVGRIAIVIIGAAKLGKPTQARVTDQHGTTHYVMVEPDAEEIALTQGDSVLLVKRINGRRFMAIPNPKPDIL